MQRRHLAATNDQNSVSNPAGSAAVPIVLAFGSSDATTGFDFEQSQPDGLGRTHLRRDERNQWQCAAADEHFDLRNFAVSNWLYDAAVGDRGFEHAAEQRARFEYVGHRR